MNRGDYYIEYGESIPGMTYPEVTINGLVYKVCEDGCATVKWDGVTNITEADIRGCVEIDGKEYSVVSIADSGFEKCMSLEKVTLRNNTRDMPMAIGNYAFYKCENLKDIFIEHNYIISIGISAFYETGITSISIPNGISYIDRHAFFGSKLKSFKAPDSLTTIAEDAFGCCRDLETVELNEGLIIIDCNAFQKCTSLSKITLPETLEIINDNAFYGCESLTSIYIPDSVVELGKFVFMNDTSLTEATFADSNLESIPSHTFAGCDMLGDVKLSVATEEVLDYTFSCCRNLQHVSVGKHTLIHPNAFYGCDEVIIERR